MVSQNLCRHRLLAGTSLIALSLYSGPVLASCLSISAGTTISGGSNSCVTWTGGNLSITNAGILSGAPTGVSISGSNPTGALTNSGAISGTLAGIYSDGSIGALTNESGGTISGFVSGIDTYGMIGALTNRGAISGWFTGIGNGGSIGTLTNSGTISGHSWAIFNGGTIGVLTNSGSVTGSDFGIDNGFGGTIGTLANSGTISGSTAIYSESSSTLGPIINSGLIAGDIVNQSAHDLTINGGSGTIYGTLTGSLGSIGSSDRGTITNTASNVVFGSGNLLLNDAINVGTHTVTNTDATLELANPVTITGAYQQTGGGLVAQAASYGSLDVSGNASVANASIVIRGSGLANGDMLTIVSDGATGSYTGDSASVIGTSGLTSTVQMVGEDLVVALATGEGPFTAKGQAAGGVAAPLGSTLDAINGGNSSSAVAFQNAVLVPLALLPSSQQGQAMKQLAPVQTSFQAIDSAATTVLGAIEQHQQTAMAYDGETGEAAGSGIRPGTLWAQALGGTAQRDSNPEAAGYHATDFGLAAGFDHLFTPDLLGGVAVSWLRAWTQGIDSASGQSSTLNNYQLTLYGTYRKGRAFLDGRVGAGWNHFDQDRSIAFLGETARAGYDGQQYLVDAQAGYDIPVGGPGDLTVTPLAGLRWLHADNGSYTESGAGAADLSVGRQTDDSLTQALGMKTSWRLATALGTVEPEITAEWVHDYLHGPIATSGVMGGEAFAVATPRIAADGARIGVAATLVKSDRLSFRAEYDGELRAGYQSHTGLLKALWQF